MDSEDTRPLLERMAAAAKAVGAVPKTGKTAITQGGLPAWSLSDLEDSVGAALVAEGVVCTHCFNSEPKVIDERGEGGKNKLWLVDVDYALWSVGSESIHCRICDVGTSPSAALSFAKKALLRTFGHVTSEEDEAAAVQETAAEPAPACPNCGLELRKSTYGRDSWYCWEKTGGCGWKGPNPAVTGELRQITEEDVRSMEETIPAAEMIPVGVETVVVPAPNPSPRAARSATAGPKPSPKPAAVPAGDDDLPGFSEPVKPPPVPKAGARPDESLTDKAHRLAIRVKMLQLEEAGQDALDARSLATLVGKSLEQASLSAFGHIFKDATDGEVNVLIGKFERFLAARAPRVQEIVEATEGRVVSS